MNNETKKKEQETESFLSDLFFLPFLAVCQFRARKRGQRTHDFSNFFKNKTK